MKIRRRKQWNIDRKDRKLVGEAVDNGGGKKIKEEISKKIISILTIDDQRRLVEGIGDI